MSTEPTTPDPTADDADTWDWDGLLPATATSWDDWQDADGTPAAPGGAR